MHVDCCLDIGSGNIASKMLCYIEKITFGYHNDDRFENLWIVSSIKDNETDGWTEIPSFIKSNGKYP